MAAAELLLFRRHIAPIRSLFQEAFPTPEMMKAAYYRVHKFPLLAVRRILGPHLLGLSIPSITVSLLMIHAGALSVPYYYVGLACMGAVLIASLHAMIEFFLTNQAIRPLLMHIQQTYASRFATDLMLNGKVLVPIQRKFQWSAFLLGTFPILIFSMATQIRLGAHAEQAAADYSRWAAVVVVMCILFSSLGAWLLARDIVHPIQGLFQAQQNVRDGDFSTQAPDLYADEFSRLVSGFNHMLEGLQIRERMNKQLIQSYFTTLAAALDARDPYTAGHSLRVADFSVRIGRLFSLSEKELDVIRRSALLHDIGKIGIRDTVLLKEGRLTDEEFTAIKQHPVLGVNILKQIDPAEAVADILPGVRSHHEQYNGGGYPDGLAGEDIPLLGRIIAIADAYDAMTSDRPYRKGMNREKALSILEEGQGLQWDPKLVPLFVRAMREEV